MLLRIVNKRILFWVLGLAWLICLPFLAVGSSSPVVLAQTAGTATPQPDILAPDVKPPGPPTSSSPQPTALPPSTRSIDFSHYSLEQGLSQSTINCIRQDSQGFMWFCTDDGLDRYDGVNFKIYKNDPQDPDSLSQNIITAIFEDHLNNLWVGTANGGLNRYDRQTARFIHYQFGSDDPHGLSSNQITVIYEDRQGVLWVGTGRGGLNRFNRETGTFLHYMNEVNNPRSINSNNVTAILEDRAGSLWVGTLNGLERFDRASGQFSHFQYDPEDRTTISSNTIHSIFEDSANNLWIGTDNGLDRLNQASGNFLHYKNDPQQPESISNNRIEVILEDHTNELWVGTFGGGLNRYNRLKDQFVRYHKDLSDPGSLSDDRILALGEDRSGVLWVGTNNGLNRLDPGYKGFEVYTNDPQNGNTLGSKSISAIQEDINGVLWIGTDNGLDKFDRRQGFVYHYRHDPDDSGSLADNTIRTLALSDSGTLWIGTANGLDRLDKGANRFIHYRYDQREPQSLSNNNIASLALDAKGQLWVATEGGGLDLYDPFTNGFSIYGNVPGDPNSLGDNSLSTLHADSKGSLWIGSIFGGLNQLNPVTGEFTHYLNNPTDANSLSDNYVLSVHEDHLGILWIGTTGGLNRLDRATGNFTRYREKDGLPNDYVFSIEEDGHGYLWLGTNNGLSRFDSQNHTFKNFDVHDGLQGNEFNQGASFASHTSELFFGGVNGLTVFYSDNIKNNPYVPPVILTSLSQRGEAIKIDRPVDTLQEVSLGWPDNYFDFEFSALNYIRPEKNQYAYMLAEFDKDWNLTGTRHNGSYTNLPGGVYTLRIKGSNNDGVWNETGISIRVTVVPPFWETWTFRGSILLIAMLITVAGYRLRVTSIEARSRQLEKQVGQRTREIAQRNKEIEALYRAGERMYRYLTLEEVLQALVDVAVEMLQANKSAVFTWNEAHDQLVVKVASGFQPDFIYTAAVVPQDGLIGKVVLSGETVCVRDTASDALYLAESGPVAEAIRAEGISSFMHLPIRLEEEVFGVFNVSFNRPYAFDDEAQRLFDALAQRAAVSIQNTRLVEQIRQLAVVEERTRLARDLHDSAKQKAFAALAQMGASNTMLQSNPEGAKTHLEEAENLVYDVIQELTFLIQEMYPRELAENGLGNALRDYLYSWENQNDIKVNLEIGGQEALGIDVEQALYRVIQEALANVARHSLARHVEIHVKYNQALVEISITDDGRGFDTSLKTNGMGLHSMKERIERIHGWFEIESAPGRGTCINISAPSKNGIK